MPYPAARTESLFSLVILTIDDTVSFRRDEFDKFTLDNHYVKGFGFKLPFFHPLLICIFFSSICN